MTNKLDNRPTLGDVSKAFKSARVVSYVGAITLTFILIILWPAVSTVVGVFGLDDFTAWVSYNVINSTQA